MNEAIVVLNAGSSSLKFAVYEMLDPERAGASAAPMRRALRGRVEGLKTDPRWVCLRGDLPLEAWPLDSVPAVDWDHARALEMILKRIAAILPEVRLRAAGHRVVHGGSRFHAPVVVDSEVLESLRQLIPLAPRHQPHGLAAVTSLQETRPDLIQVACFDTAFHATQNILAQRFPLPRVWHEEHGVRGYGFHGLSYESVVGRLSEQGDAVSDGRIVVAHLGSGSSLAAIAEGRCVATTMGLTPLDGLMMGTRSGRLDPGVLLYFMREHGYDEARISRMLHDESGLLGVSGLSSDMRTLLASDSPFAREAVDLFVFRAAQEIASMIVPLGGIDALVFTGGVGENSAWVRAAICDRLQWLGIDLVAENNESSASRISSKRSAVTVCVVPTDEEAVIAEHTRGLLQGSTPWLARPA